MKCASVIDTLVARRGGIEEVVLRTTGVEGVVLRNEGHGGAPSFRSGGEQVVLAHGGEFGI